jgi:hypothetical protein
MEQIEPNLQQIKTLSYDQAKHHMMRERLDLETILTKYELMYKNTSGEGHQLATRLTSTPQS